MTRYRWLLVLTALACKSKEEAASRQMEVSATVGATAPMAPAPEPAPAADMDRSKAEEATADEADDGAGARGGKGGPGGGAAAKPARSWFPETFLFEPLVVTDAQGVAAHKVRVPDRLTTYRVLGLAHSRDGAQAGGIAQLASTLPIYVEPVVPPFLVAGDVVRVPVQVVNTGDAPVSTRLVLTADGATLAGGSGPITVAARSSGLVRATLTARRPGAIRLQASLDGGDAVVRTIAVRPAGRPVEQRVSGTLAAPRTLTLTGAAAATPGTDRATLQVFPGALALLRSELAASLDRGGPADDAFALLLAGQAPALLQSLGEEVDPVALRHLTIVASQRVVRRAVSLDTDTAALIAEAALAHPGSPMLSSLGARAVQYLVQHQLPDGTCGGETGWTLQRLLVATADCARAARSQPAVVLRASGAVERNAARIDDAYTAAALLASGAATGPLAEALRARVRSALVKSGDGSQSLPVPDGVVRADGVRPSTLEATALAVLALDGDPQVADLGATLLGGYAPARGWGDGRANLVAMQAVMRLFRDPVPPRTRIVLRLDDRVVAEGELTREQVRSIVTLDVPAVDAAGVHTWRVEAQPAVPGLGFSFALTSWAPWPPAPTGTGLSIETALPPALTVGAPAELRIRAAAPADRPVHVRLGLPAGVQVDTARLDPLVSAGTLTRYTAAAGSLELFAPPLAAGQPLVVTIRVIPTLAGSLLGGPAEVIVDGGAATAPPVRWTIGG